jgi:hypothetical protein
MSALQQKYDWLETAFTERVGCINESFYFDAKDNQLFSIFMTDYYLTDPHLNADFNDPYTIEEFESLVQRIDRIEKDDRSIICIPRLSIDDRKLLLKSFLNDQQLQDIAVLQRFVEEENGRTWLDFNNELDETYKVKWQAFKTHFVKPYIDRFCLLHNIELETVTMFTNEKVSSITFDLSYPVEPETEQEQEKVTEPDPTTETPEKKKSRFSLLKLFRFKKS